MLGAKRLTMCGLFLLLACSPEPAAQDAGVGPGGGGGGGGSSDSGTGGSYQGGELPRSEWPEGLAEIADSLDALVTGGDTDITGDGVPDIQTHVSGDARTVTLLGESGGAALEVSYASAESLNVTGDLNEDGAADFAFEALRSGASLVEQGSADRDFDGAEDERVRIETNLDTQAWTETRERLESFPDGGSDWVLEFERTSDTLVEQAGCDSMEGFPSFDGAGWNPLGRDNIKIITNGEPGSCTDAQAANLARNFNEAVKKGLSCLKKTNSEFALKLATALANRPLYVGCSNKCSLAAADADGHWRSYLGRQRMNFGNQSATPQQLQSLILHELLHWSGKHHDHGEDGNGGTDDVYSCARLCMGCEASNFTLGGGNPKQDCEKCADTAKMASACGTKKMLKKGECPELALCHAGLGGNFHCASCMVRENQNCDGSSLPPAQANTQFACCATCPDSGQSNDVPCASTAEMVEMDCPAMPPVCSP